MTLIAGDALVIVAVDPALAEYSPELLAGELLRAEAMRGRIGQGAGPCPSGPGLVAGFLAEPDDCEVSAGSPTGPPSAREPAPRSLFADALARMRGWADGRQI